jgi:hypothetical protein
VRIFHEDEALSRQILREDERTEARELCRRRLQRPRARQRAGLERLLQFVFRKDRQVVENPHARSERRRKRDDHRQRVDRRDGQLLAIGLQGIREHTRRPFVVRRGKREHHIVCCEGVTV